MAFESAGLEVEGVPVDEHGLQVDVLEERLEAGLRPKLLYVIPEYQNPSGLTLSLERRHALVELCRRFDVLIFEDVAYREISFDGSSLPSLWSLAPDVVLQAGTFSKVLSPGVRLGWATARPDVIARLAAAKQLTDQCAGALGQRIVEEYGRAGLFERGVPRSRELYASHWRALDSALRAHMPDGRDVERANRRLLQLDDRPRRRDGAASGRSGGGRHVRARLAVRRPAEHAAAVVQPARRGRAGNGRGTAVHTLLERAMSPRCGGRLWA